MAGDVEAGRAFVKLLAEDKELRDTFAALERSVGDIANRVQKAGAAIGAVGATITAPFVLAAKRFIDIGSGLADMSARTRESVQSLSELKYGAEQTGTSLSMIEKAIILARSQGKSFDELAAQVFAVKDPVDQLEKSIELFGKKIGSAITPMLRDLPALRAAAKEAGATMDAETAAAADKLGDILYDLKAAVNSLAVAVGSALAEDLIRLAELITDCIGPVSNWIKENKSLVTTVGALGLAASILGPSLIAVSFGMRAAATGAIALRVALNFLSRHPVIAAVVLLAGGVLYLTDCFGLLSDEVESADEQVAKLEKGLKDRSTSMATTNAQMVTDVQQTQTAIVDAEKAAYEKREQMLQQFSQERQGANRDQLDSFIDDNAKNLKEAVERNNAIMDARMKRLNPERFEAEERRRKLAAEQAEVRRQFNLLNNMDQLKQNQAIGRFRDFALSVEARTKQGLPINDTERRALDAFNRQNDGDPREVAKKLDEIKGVPTNILEAGRDGGFMGGLEYWVGHAMQQWCLRAAVTLGWRRQRNSYAITATIS